jgi:hypothetical protein
MGVRELNTKKEGIPNKTIFGHFFQIIKSEGITHKKLTKSKNFGTVKIEKHTFDCLKIFAFKLFVCNSLTFFFFKKLDQNN